VSCKDVSLQRRNIEETTEVKRKRSKRKRSSVYCSVNTSCTCN